MHYAYFEIKNFKGIREARLTLDPGLGIYTLVGLNESGKTTILEAISLISKRDNERPSGNTAVDDPRTYIPLHQSADFTGRIEITAGIAFDKDERQMLMSLVRLPKGTRLEIGEHCTLDRHFIFERGEFKGEDSGFVVPLHKVTPKRQVALSKADHDTIINAIRDRLPQVLFFPDFLVDIPEKIYVDLEITLPGSANTTNVYYADLFSDIFRAENFNLQGDVLSRMDSDDDLTRQQAGAMLRRVEGNMTREIIKGWKEILKQPNGPGDIEIENARDGVGRYFRLYIRKGDDAYRIDQRSLGFRWYFAYVLLTHYRLYRNERRRVIYLFDEPASNLHSAAQQRLLRSLADLQKHGGTVIYTTHSHHMIKPEWLEGAYVVENIGLVYDAEDDFGTGETNIKLTRYRKYVSDEGTDTTHIQPIIDALDYQPSGLEFRRNAIVTEGKNDFYALRYFASMLGEEDWHIIPGTGASNLDAIASIYVGWGWPFVVLHDADDKGRSQHERMKVAFDMVSPLHFALLTDFVSDQTVEATESLVVPSDQLLIQKEAGRSETRYDKKQFNDSIQELLATEKIVAVSDKTKDRLRELFKGLRERLEELEQRV